MSFRQQSLRIALLIEASTLPVFFVHISRAVSDVLSTWFFILNTPIILIFGDPPLRMRDGEIGSLFLDIVPIVIFQTVIWFCVCHGLLLVFEKIKTRWRKRHDA
jgi:hypothetical protein